MCGVTLADLRRRLTDLATGGSYRVACLDTGERPYPVTDQRFPDRETARDAVELAARYRERLAAYDPRAPTYDLAVEHARDAGGDPDRAPPREACGLLAGALFDALGDCGETDVERTILDTYIAAASETTDPDALGVALLDTIAGVLDDALPPARQQAVVARATDHLPEDADTVAAALDALRDGSLLSGYAYRTRTGRLDLRLDGYAFDADDDRLPTLPLTVALARANRTVAVTDAHRTRTGDWRLSLSLDADAPRGLARATVTP
ncbi:DUF7551 domain-containing protein [Salarchaeum japonicum]|uniref:Uncharacterized protein n=1 Tax=Salarchaeum japonicum TaxID=555573 RepID=A0AAV3T2D0_9EURY|nr:hypothetical protein [Salarchaeum japonicum]